MIQRGNQRILRHINRKYFFNMFSYKIILLNVGENITYFTCYNHFHACNQCMFVTEYHEINVIIAVTIVKGI